MPPIGAATRLLKPVVRGGHEHGRGDLHRLDRYRGPIRPCGDEIRQAETGEHAGGGQVVDQQHAQGQREENVQVAPRTAELADGVARSVAFAAGIGAHHGALEERGEGSPISRL